MRLQVEGLRFAYNGLPVLREVSFALQGGEILAVLGINGAGKTTLLKCLNRILRPQGGRVLLDGKEVRRMSRKETARHFAYVPQKYGEEPLSVFDTVLLGRRPYIRWEATAKDLEIVEAILYRLKLEHLALRPTNQLSGGELQKVIIGRALAQEPDVLLLDEPTSNLDLKNQLQVMRLVRRAVREHGLAAVVSIHDINLALRFSDRLLMLKDGRVHLAAPKDQVAEKDIEEVYGLKVKFQEWEAIKVVIPLKEEETL